MFKKTFKISAVLLFVLLFSDCNKDLLNKVPKASLSEDIVWTSSGAATEFVNGIYGTMISGFERQEQDWGAGLWMLDVATDDGSMCYDWTAATQLIMANYGPSNSPLYNQWGAYYALIRKCNLALANLNKITGNDAVKNRLIGECYFLRAYVYQELLRFYGVRSTDAGTGVPIIKLPLGPNDNFQFSRASYDETVNFIVSDLDTATPLLPNVGETDAGRATKGAALALKSRVLLYAPRWADAATAAKAVMELNPGYSLYPDYRKVFLDKNNSEVIFAKKFINPTLVHGGNGLGYTPGYDVVNTLVGGSFGGGWGGTCPTQNLVDAYAMTDGKPTTTSPLYDPNSPYANLDPRFYATVLYNGSTFRGGTVETFDGGADDRSDNGAQDGTKTGYYIRKFHNEAAILYTTGGDEDWIFIRYAEVLLNYAEAQNEAAGPDPSVYSAINQIRARPSVNMPAISGLSQSDMRTAIRNERRVELTFEEHRFFDLRRWGTASTVLNGPVGGMEIIKNGSNFTYKRFNLDPRTYLDKMIVLPIPQAEITKNPACKQIAGW